MREGTKLTLLTPGSPEPGTEQTTITYRIKGNYYQIQENFFKGIKYGKTVIHVTFFSQKEI